MQDTIIMRALTRCVRYYPTELNRLFVIKWLTYVSEDIGLLNDVSRVDGNFCFVVCVDLYRYRGQRMNVKVRNGNVEQALRIFKRKINDSNKLFDYREKEYYEKPTTRRQKKKASAVARERKRQEKLAQNPLSLK